MRTSKRSLEKIVFSALIFACCYAELVYAVNPVHPGGSNYGWYKIDAATQPAPVGSNCRENYGIIKNYQNAGVRDLVINQLMQMKANGQQRLRVPLYHMRNASGGTLLVSQGGNLSAHDRESLRLFLSDIRDIGFSEILFGFFPIGQNSPVNWPSWNEDLFQENWNLIANIRPIIKNSGILYRIDLMNEGAPANHQTQLKEYVRKLWINYNLTYGKADTVGVSVIGQANEGDTTYRGTIDRYNTTKNIYDATPFGSPYLWSIHFYANLKGNFLALDNAMNARGDNTGIIIGETFYDDAASWNAIKQTNISRTVWHVYQWPVTPSRGCDGHVDVTPPLKYRYHDSLTQTVNLAPKGALDGIDSNTGRVWGWACDPSTPGQSARVHFYADGPAGKGRLIKAITANKASGAAVKSACGGGDTYRYNYVATDADIQKIGPGAHAIYVYAIDTENGPSKLLAGSPKTINIAQTKTFR